MEIRSVNVTPVRVPVTRIGAFVKAKRTHVSRTIVEIETGDGLTGIGETRGEWAATILEGFGSRITELDAADRESIRSACLLEKFDYGKPELLVEQEAFAAIELALWDLAGKAAGEPVYNLLGGPVRERAPFVAYAYTVDPAEGRGAEEIPKIMAEIAARDIEASAATMFEFKIGLHPIEVEVAIVEAIRQAVGPDVALAVDANMGLSFEDARWFLDDTMEFGIANIEEPVLSLSDLAQLRRETSVPVSTHCYDLDALTPYPEIDAVVSDPHLHGGIDGTIELMTQIIRAGRRFWLRSSWELGISWAAMCHLGMARPELERPAQALINWVADDLVLGPTWLVEGGGVRPPDSPGLGVELDRDALKRYAVT